MTEQVKPTVNNTNQSHSLKPENCIIRSSMNIHKHHINDCKPEIGGDRTTHKPVTKKSRVDELLLLKPDLQRDISYNELHHNRLMMMCHEELVARNVITFPQNLSPNAKMLLKMSVINHCLMEQNSTNDFDNRFFSIGETSLHTFHRGQSMIGKNTMRLPNLTFGTRKVNTLPVVQSQLSPTTHSQLEKGYQKQNSNSGCKIRQTGDASSVPNKLSNLEHSHDNSGRISTSPSLNSISPQETTTPSKLPFCLAQPVDKYKLSEHQQFLRFQIEAFQATEDDVNIHTRGRNKRIVLGQVGIRCRHCAHLPVSHRQKGSAYFPANTMGLYQAAQNMSTAHIQCGLCTEMPEYIKEHFKGLIATKAFTTGAGRPYWDKSAKEIGLVNTENGICFIHDLPPGARIVDDYQN